MREREREREKGRESARLMPHEHDPKEERENLRLPPSATPVIVFMGPTYCNSIHTSI
jgi:hypothetical protein